MHACVQSWEWPGHSTRVLQPTARNSLAVCHQGLSLHVSCRHRLAKPEHPSTATGTLGILALSLPLCLATPHHLLGMGPWRYVRLRMLNARSHSAAFSCSRDSAVTLLACASLAASSAASNRSSRPLSRACILAMVASCLTTCSRASRSFLVACSVARSASLAATCDRLLNGIRQHLLQRRAHDLLQPGASCVITVPVSIAIGLARPGLPGTRRLEGESGMMVLWAGHFTDPRAGLSDCSGLTSALGCCHSGCVRFSVPGCFFTCERPPN